VEPGSEALRDHSSLDALGFAPAFSLNGTDWSKVPDSPGVCVIFDGAEIALSVWPAAMAAVHSGAGSRIMRPGKS